MRRLAESDPDLFVRNVTVVIYDTKGTEAATARADGNCFVPQRPVRLCPPTVQVRKGMISTPSPGKTVICGWSWNSRAAASAVSASTTT